MLIVACVQTPLPLLSIFPDGRMEGSVDRLCSLFSFSPLATLVTRRELAPKCVPHFLLGSLMERDSQPLAIFPLSLVTVPEVFAKVNSALFLYLFFFFLIFFFNFIFIAPLAPYVGEITDISASKSSAVIQLWPAEQRNGPIRYDHSLICSLINRFPKNISQKVHLLSNKSFCKSPNQVILK